MLCGVRYHHGQFSQVIDKRNPYEEDVRIPLLVRPPTAGSLFTHHRHHTITAGEAVATGGPGRRKISELVLSIDVAPTVLQLAGVPTPSSMDGRSWVPLLQLAGQAGQGQGRAMGPAVGTADAVPWRTDALIEYRLLSYSILQ